MVGLTVRPPFQISKLMLYSCFPRENLLASSGVMFVPLYQNMVGMMVHSNVLFFLNPFIKLL